MRCGVCSRRDGAIRERRHDHLKTTADIDLCVAAGYTFYTIDPGDHVDNAAHTDELAVLREKFNVLPWQQLQNYPDAMRARYLVMGEGWRHGRSTWPGL